MAEVFRNDKIHVLSDKCTSCIFRSVNDGRIMGLTPGRVAGMVLGAREDPMGNIPCHSTLYDENVRPAICKGWWDREAMKQVPLRLAESIGIVVYDEPPV